MNQPTRTEEGRLTDRLQTDKRLAHLFDMMAKNADADNVLFGTVFHQKLLSLEDVERLLVVATRMELYVRCRREVWSGQ